MTDGVDPITLGVIWGALQSIAVEIGTNVHKTAYSEQAREGQDFSVAVFDDRGRMVAQGPYSPGHMGAMSFAVKNALAAHPADTLAPGDAILLNDPLLGSGHLPDFFITQPVFHEGRLRDEEVGEVAGAEQRIVEEDGVAGPQCLHGVRGQGVPHRERHRAHVPRRVGPLRDHPALRVEDGHREVLTLPRLLGVRRLVHRGPDLHGDRLQRAPDDA